MISICIPTYEMHGEATTFLKRSFNVLLSQTFKDFEVVISDNSDDNTIKNLCAKEQYATLAINYVKSPRKGMAQNTNESIKKAKGDLIKILYMDDFLAHENALREIAENFSGYWLITGCAHDDGSGVRINPHFPKYTDKIGWGENTIGSPSVLTIKNEYPLLFDENMTWLLDCDYYKRLYEKYGKPVILDKVNVIIGLGKHQTTNHLSDPQKQLEHEYLVQKYQKNQHSHLK